MNFRSTSAIWKVGLSYTLLKKAGNTFSSFENIAGWMAGQPKSVVNKAYLNG